MKVVGIVQARMSSTRLPGKMMLEVLERPVILRWFEAGWILVDGVGVKMGIEVIRKCAYPEVRKA